MSVKRYQMQESVFGPFVSYKDFFKLEADYAALLDRVERLEGAGKNILRKIPKTKNDYSGVGYCFGCGVVKWASGQGNYSEECKPDCVL